MKDIINCIDLYEKMMVLKKEKGITFRFIAQQSGIDETTLSHWRNGRRALPEHYIEKLKETLDNLL